MQAGHPLHFTQVTPGTDLSAILWRWAGSFTVEGPTLQGTAVARFSNKKVGLCKCAALIRKRRSPLVQLQLQGLNGQ